MKYSRTGCTDTEERTMATTVKPGDLVYFTAGTREWLVTAVVDGIATLQARGRTRTADVDALIVIGHRRAGA